MKKFYPTLFAFLLSGTMLAQDFTVQEVSFKNDTTELFAYVFIPQSSNAKKVGIALVQGSGNSDRRNAWSRAFAISLAENGYYVLLPDKRGSGKSKGNWKTSSFHLLAQDALVSSSFLRKSFLLDKVGLMGLSQGGFIVPIAASADSSIDFIVNIVGAAVPLGEQIIHEVTNTAKKEGLSPKEINEMLLYHIALEEYAKNRNWHKLKAHINAAERSSWSKFAATLPRAKDSWIWDWANLNSDFDPIHYWTKVKQDVFVAYGSKDDNDNMPVYASIHRLHKNFASIGKTNYRIQVYETGHAMYEDNKAELRQEFLDDLFNWLRNRK